MNLNDFGPSSFFSKTSSQFLFKTSYCTLYLRAIHLAERVHHGIGSLAAIRQCRACQRRGEGVGRGALTTLYLRAVHLAERVHHATAGSLDTIGQCRALKQSSI